MVRVPLLEGLDLIVGEGELRTEVDKTSGFGAMLETSNKSRRWKKNQAQQPTFVAPDFPLPPVGAKIRRFTVLGYEIVGTKGGVWMLARCNCGVEFKYPASASSIQHRVTCGTCPVRSHREPPSPTYLAYRAAVPFSNTSWKNFNSMLKDIGPMPVDGEYYLARIDPTRPYGIGNARWAHTSEPPAPQDVGAQKIKAHYPKGYTRISRPAK